MSLHPPKALQALTALHAPMTIGEIQHMVGTWADRVFPDRTVHSSLSKLVMEEVPEFLLAKGDDAMEYADLVILILDVAHQKGINVEAAVLAKHRKNEERSWAKDPTTGAYHHVGQRIDLASVRHERIDVTTFDDPAPAALDVVDETGGVTVVEPEVDCTRCGCLHPADLDCRDEDAP